MSEQEQQQQQDGDPYRKQAELSAIQRADQIGIDRQHEQVAKHQFNPGFFRETTDPDLDTEFYDWIENELGPKTSRAHALGHRPEEYAEQQALLNRNEAERIIMERQPGHLLKKNWSVLAVFAGATDVELREDGTLDYVDDAFPSIIDQDHERRALRDAMEAVTTRESLAIEGVFLDGLTKATTETQHRDRVSDEESGTARRVGSIFK